MSGGRVFTSVSVGESHVCGLVSGIAYCWGANTYGQLGVGTPGPTCAFYNNAAQCSAIPLAASVPSSVRQVSAGAYSTCAVTSGTVTYCWAITAMVNSAQAP